MNEVNQNKERRHFRPSNFLRQRRPERYSDSIVTDVPDLTRNQLEYHLKTLTSRNQEKEFEYFARKLAEKILCPNLIPQTGPTGGGDSKVDTETYPVAESIANTWYQGNDSASERWAFAFSAKKDWSSKVRSDVKNISNTGRDYILIYFISNQFISDKQRAKREDKLSEEFGIPVRILSRDWIVEQVFERDCINIVEQTLSVDDLQFSPRKQIGPNDAQREIELDAIDKEISNPGRYSGVEYQLAEDILEGARLASELGRNRHEVDGRFVAALRVADNVGDPRQILRIYYKQAWNSCFVYDDLQELSKLYDNVSKLALASEYADDAEYATNLLNVLVTSTVTGLISPEAAKIDERLEALVEHLESLAGDDARPNNAYKAKGMLCLLRFVLTKAGHIKSPSVDEIITELNTVLTQVDKLGEFPFESYKDIIMELGNFFTDNDSFNQLLDTVISVIEKRSSEGEAGATLVERAIQISSAGNIYEAIKMLGKAQEKLVKDEYLFELVKSLLALGYTYNLAGLKWAARTSFLAVLSKTISEFHKSGYMHRFAYMAVKQLVFIELKIGRLPHVLFAISLANFIGMHARIDEDEFYEFIQHADAILTMLILRLDKDQLEHMTKLSTKLDQLGLICSEGGLLFALGHLDRLREDVWFEKNDSNEKIEQFYQVVCSQPAYDDLPDSPELGNQETTVISSNILGCTFHITMNSNPISLLIAESLLGSLEAFLATSINEKLMPHKQEVTIGVGVVDDAREVAGIRIVDENENSDLLIQHDNKFNLKSKNKILEFRDFITLFIAKCVSKFTLIDDFEIYMEKLARDERCFSRALLFSDVMTLSDNVFGSLNWINVELWPGSDDTEYPLIRANLWQPSEEEKKNFNEAVKRGAGVPPDDLVSAQNIKHSDRKVLSVIDTPLWDKAKWRGAFFQVVPTKEAPPCLGFLFEDENAARNIFSDWNNRFGQKDENDEIKLVVITGIDKNNPSHYRIFVGSNLENYIEGNKSKQFIMVSRNQTMTPDTSENLDMFLEAYKYFRCYFLMPSILKKNNVQPKVLTDIYILKKNLVVKPAWKVADNDDEITAIQPDDDPIIPPDIKNPPILKTLERVRRRRNR